MTRIHAARIGAAFAVAAFVAIGTPAFADELGGRFNIESQEIGIDIDSGHSTSSLHGDYESTRSGELTDVRVTVDFSGVSDFVDGSAIPGSDELKCSNIGLLWTCTAYDMTFDGAEYHTVSMPDLVFDTRTGLTGEGDIKVSISATGASSQTVDIPVAVAEPLDLDLGKAPKVTGAPGDVVTINLPVTNNGDRTAYNPVFWVTTANADAAAPVPSNCAAGRGQESSAYSEITCEFPVAIAPGATYTVPLRFVIRADALAEPAGYTTAHWTTGKLDATGLVRGTAPAITLSGAEPAPAKTPVQRNTNGDWWQNQIITVTGTSAPDLVALGATIPAKTGPATITVGLRNDGPAAIPAGNSGDPRTAVWFTLPKGVELVELPDEVCYQPKPGEWDANAPATVVCGRFTDIMVGGTVTFDLKINVKSVDLKEKGFVKVGYSFYGDVQPQFDRDPSNSVADIAFEDATSGTGVGDGLANTGVQAGVIGATGAALAVAGFVAFRTFRRRANATHYGPADE